MGAKVSRLSHMRAVMSRSRRAPGRIVPHCRFWTAGIADAIFDP
jgi:hypothetical protein